MLKKVTRRLVHPVLGRTIRFFKAYITGRAAIPEPRVGHPSQLFDPYIPHQTGHGLQGATRRQVALERRARRIEEAKRARALRRARAARPIPGTFSYGSFTELAPHLPQAPVVTTQHHSVPCDLCATRATGSFKRGKPLASAPERQQSQKHRSVRNLARHDAAKGLSKLSVDVEGLLPDSNTVFPGMSPEQPAGDSMPMEALPRPTVSTDASRPRCRGRYGLFAEDSQDSSFSVHVEEGGFNRDEGATRVSKERKEKELKNLKEEEARRKEDDAANCNPFLTHIRKPTGRRVVSNVYQPAHPSPTFDPLANRNQHAESLRKARQAEENERRAKEETLRVQEFQRRIRHLRLQQEEDEAWERLKMERLEQQRLNVEQSQRQHAAKNRKADIHHSTSIDADDTSNSMDIDRPLTIQDRFDIYDKKWDTLTRKGPRNLSFLDMPWPVLCDARDLSTLTPVNIETFIAHSIRRAGKGRRGLKWLVKEDILMWHPDRFAKFRKAISQSQWAMIQQGVNIVAQVLIQMKENVDQFV